jgi:mono/diheme cytochrome c family protein
MLMRVTPTPNESNEPVMKQSATITIGSLSDRKLRLHGKKRRPTTASALAARLLCAALLLAFVPGCTILDPNPEATIGGTDTGPVTGEQLFLNYCAGCHGIDGVPSDTSVKTLRGWPGDYATFDSTLTVGPNAMPTFPELDSVARGKIFDHIKKFPPL